MKVCPVCNQTYTDENLNFCLNDGGTLTELKDDAPPTIFMDRGRTTQPNWGEYEAPSPYLNQPLQPYQSATPNQPFMTGAPVQGQNQVLPTISLIFGVLGLVLMCCWGGIPFGIAAAVTGFLGYQNANKDSLSYGGRGLAIAGMILGIIGFISGIILFMLGILGNILK